MISGPIHVPTAEETAADREFVMSKKHELPESPENNPPRSVEETLEDYNFQLSPFEKTEIESFKSIYYIGCTAKIMASENALDTSEYTMNRKYIFVPKDHISYRYKALGVAGEGQYAEVIRCTDMKAKNRVVVKMLKKNNPFLFHETKMLLHIQDNDLEGKSKCINLLDYDCFRGHHYLVFPEFDTDLGTFLRFGYFDIRVDYNFQKMMVVAKCVAKALVFLKQQNIIHGDLKTDNILINVNRWNETKLGDFGLAMFTDDVVYCREYQTLAYRAPEIFCLGLATTAADMWSFGCVLAEIVIGRKFLMARNVHNQFFLIQQVLGSPPASFFEYCKDTSPYFDGLRYPKHCRLVVNMDGDYLVVKEHPNISPRTLPPGATPIESLFNKTVFRDFLERCFLWHPFERIQPEEVLTHALFNDVKS